MTTTEEMVRDSRWELRVWGIDAGVADALSSLSPDPEMIAQVDCFLIGPRHEFSARIRGGELEVKRLLERRAGFQRWSPDWTSSPPHEPAQLERLFIELGAGLDDAKLSSMNNGELVDLVRSKNRLRAVDVSTKSRHFDVGVVDAEVTEVEIDGAAPMKCVLLQSSDIERAIELRDQLGLQGAPNVALHTEIKHTIARTAPDGD